jgi:hypothetical protein
LDEKQLKQIVFFYKDNTFKIFENWIIFDYED